MYSLFVVVLFISFFSLHIYWDIFITNTNKLLQRIGICAA